MKLWRVTLMHRGTGEILELRVPAHSQYRAVTLVYEPERTEPPLPWAAYDRSQWYLYSVAEVVEVAG